MSEQEQTLKYDPSKNYEWKPEDSFQMTGQEFAFIYNNLMVEKRELVSKLEILTILEQKLVKAVESGVAIESVPKDQVAEVLEEVITPS